MIRAILAGALNDVAFEKDGRFNLDVPRMCPDVPAQALNPKHTRANEAEYDVQAAKLAHMFTDNFKTFEGAVGAAVKAAGPRA